MYVLQLLYCNKEIIVNFDRAIQTNAFRTEQAKFLFVWNIRYGIIEESCYGTRGPTQSECFHGLIPNSDSPRGFRRKRECESEDSVLVSIRLPSPRCHSASYQFLRRLSKDMTSNARFTLILARECRSLTLLPPPLAETLPKVYRRRLARVWIGHNRISRLNNSLIAFHLVSEVI